MSRPSAREPSEGSATSPTVLHRWLSHRLRALRRSTGLTQAEAADRVGWSHGKIGHLETRHVGIRAEDLRALLPVYGVAGRDIDRYVSYAQRARQHGWWHHAAGIPDALRHYVGLEWGASQLYTYTLGLIPDMLQTSEYARAALAAEAPDAADLDTPVAHRMRRQQTLSRDQSPLRLHALIDEAALHRQIGDPGVMRRQLAYLATHARGRNRHVQVQIVPFDIGPHRGLLGSFSWLLFPNSADSEDPGVVYLDTHLGASYVDDADTVDRFRRDHHDLRAQALTPEQSATLLEDHDRRFRDRVMS